MTACSLVPRFDWRDGAALDYFRAHGFAVVRGVLSAYERALVAAGYSELAAEGAARAQLLPEQFTRKFPQSRDVWRKHDSFRSLLQGGAQAAAAMRFLETSGVRLFHDHVIAKPSRASGVIPWHQDSTYWPLDRPGLSLWTSVEDVGTEGGSLRVLDGSHRDGPGPPRDFLASRDERDPLDDDPRLVALPVTAGETVILHGLTWHGSGENTSDRDRLAYLTLWVPATARFLRQNAAWHPATRQVLVEDGERLDGEWFPLFGEVLDRDDRGPVRFCPPSAPQGPSMFAAGDDIAAQICWLLDRPPEPLHRLLERLGASDIAARAIARGLLDPGEEHVVIDLLADLELQERVRRESVARDVYLRSVVSWWQLVGTRIEKARREP